MLRATATMDRADPHVEAITLDPADPYGARAALAFMPTSEEARLLGRTDADRLERFQEIVAAGLEALRRA